MVFYYSKKNESWVCSTEKQEKEGCSEKITLVPLNQVSNICQGIVHYVSRTQESVVLVDALESAEFQNLPEVSIYSIRSLLCVPIMRNTDLMGILYLENRLSPGVFTAERVRMIKLLSLQMAISLENARLISEIGQFNIELEQRVQEISEKNREKDHLLIQQSKLATMGEMINNIAHQWRQPLNALSLLLGNVQDAKQFDELSPEYLDQQIENGFIYIDKMSNTINDFRDFFSPNKAHEVFSAREAVEDAIALVEASFKVHSIQIIKNMPEDIKLFGVLNEYAQVVLNLLTNAKEAILSQGSTGVIKVNLCTQQGKVLLKVQDDGGGVNDEVLDHIFEPYFSTKEGGMGIGLYMSKMIVETSLMGQLQVCNKQDGAEFSIISPFLSENNNFKIGSVDR